MPCLEEEVVGVVRIHYKDAHHLAVAGELEHCHPPALPQPVVIAEGATLLAGEPVEGCWHSRVPRKADLLH